MTPEELFLPRLEGMIESYLRAYGAGNATWLMLDECHQRLTALAPPAATPAGEAVDYKAAWEQLIEWCGSCIRKTSCSADAMIGLAMAYEKMMELAVPQPEAKAKLLAGSLTVGTYGGFTGIARWDSEAKHYHGMVGLPRDVVTFVGRNDTEVIQAFQDSVDDYMEQCRTPSAGDGGEEG